MGTATAAFPGLQELVDAMGERSLDSEDAIIDVSRVRAEHAGPVLGAAAKLALIGAMAQAAERFDLHDIVDVDCARFCQEASTESAAAWCSHQRWGQPAVRHRVDRPRRTL